MNIDNVRFGNQPKEYVDKIKNDKYGKLKKAKESGMLKEFIEKYPPPANSSDIVKNELKHLKKIVDNATKEQERLCFYMEHHHLDFFVKTAKKLGIDNVDRKQVNTWSDEIFPIIYYLKDYFNRPRPNELAREYDINLNPITRTDANSAAYPSGHAIDFLVIIYHLTKLKPEASKKLNEIYEDIKDVREISGVHFPSDRKGSENLFRLLVKYKIIN
jgi:hypothetical protein